MDVTDTTGEEYAYLTLYPFMIEEGIDKAEKNVFSGLWRMSEDQRADYHLDWDDYRHQAMQLASVVTRVRGVDIHTSAFYELPTPQTPGAAAAAAALERWAKHFYANGCLYVPELATKVLGDEAMEAALEAEKVLISQNKTDSSTLPWYLQAGGEGDLSFFCTRFRSEWQRRRESLVCMARPMSEWTTSLGALQWCPAHSVGRAMWRLVAEFFAGEQWARHNSPTFSQAVSMTLRAKARLAVDKSWGLLVDE